MRGGLVIRGGCPFLGFSGVEGGHEVGTPGFIERGRLLFQKDS